MTAQTYKHAPIVEAVVEFRFEQAIAKEKIDSIAKKMHARFSISEDLTESELIVDIASKKVETRDTIRKKLSNEDATETVTISPSSLVISRFAPYYSFGDLLKNCELAWDTCYKITGYRKINQIGVRFINRIDLPYENSVVNFEDYFNLRINVPKKYDMIGKYALRLDIPLQSIGGFVRINSAIGDDVIINHAAFVIDIDVIRSVEPPQKKEEIFSLLKDMRREKNELFESFITSKCRDIFNAE